MIPNFAQFVLAPQRRKIFSFRQADSLPMIAFFGKSRNCPRRVQLGSKGQLVFQHPDAPWRGCSDVGIDTRIEGGPAFVLATARPRHRTSSP